MKSIKTYYRLLNKDEKMTFVKVAGCSQRYLEIHLFAPNGPRKNPRKGMMENLAKATKGELTFMDVMVFFYESPKEEVK